MTVAVTEPASAPIPWRKLLETPDKPLPNDFNIDAEATYYESLEAGALRQVLETLEVERALGAGGSGTIFVCRSRRSNRLRAMKLPRKTFADEVARTIADDMGAAPLNLEVEALDKLFHTNIVRLHEAVSVDAYVDAVLMGYIPDADDLDVYVEKLVGADTARNSMHEVIAAFGKIVLVIADAIAYVHDVGEMYHFDIKPGNIIVDAAGVPYLTDFGFARHTAARKPDDTIDIGFTWRYAHPKLRDPYEGHARIDLTPAKCKAKLEAADLSPRFDLFAFGRTIQECLWIIKNYYHDRVFSSYAFNYLHVLACLLLDEEHATKESSAEIRGRTRGFVTSAALQYPPAFFAQHKLTRAEQVLDRLRRLHGMVQIEVAVPELDRWHPKAVNASDLGYATLTDRIARIINHPAFDRLNSERQLGMLSRVYPTATHTRANHSLGTYLAVCLYLEALYRDPDLPTFKVVVEWSDFERAMVAALIHDLGQTALGHDLEEVSDVFKHELFVEKIAADESFVDGDGRTLQKLIERDWGFTLEDVLRLLTVGARRPIDHLLHDCLDGFIDADKLDYLIRDTVDARVPYGRGIDVPRFLRSLTVTVQPGDNAKEARMVLTVRSKASPAAHTLAFARYEMHAALYWQHTFRVIKSMILDAAARGFRHTREASGSQRRLFSDDELQATFYNFVICGKPWPVPPAPVPSKARKRRVDVSSGPIASLETADTIPTAPSKVAADRTLHMLWNFGDDGARRLLDAATRPGGLYKRVYELSVDRISENGRYHLHTLFAREARAATRDAVRAQLFAELAGAAQGRAPSESYRKDDTLAVIDELRSDDACVTIDCPLRAWLPEGEIPYTLPDYKRKFFEPSIGSADQNKEFWDKTVMSLMRQAAMLRVFASPKLHDLVRELINPEDIQRAVKAALPKLFA